MAAGIISLGILVFCAHLFASLFRRLRVPDVLLLMCLGIVVGPVLNWVTPQQFEDVGPLLASLTLLLILFDSGIDLSIDSIRRYWKGVVQVAFLSYVLSSTAVMVCAVYLLGFGWLEGCLLGAMVSGTAAAIVIPMVRQMRVSEKTRTTLTLESACSGVLSIVISLAFIEGYKMGNLQIGLMVGQVFASFLMALLLGFVSGIVWAGMLDRVRSLKNSMFLTPAFVAIVYGITEVLGFSGAISALAFGIVLGNIDYFNFPFLHRFSNFNMRELTANEKSFFKEFVFLLKTFFFVYIGICIPFTNGPALLYGLIISALLFVVRFILVSIVGHKNTRNDRLTVSIMIPKGLIAAVLASVPEQLNITLGYEAIPGATMMKYITYSVIFFSIVIASILVLLTSKKLVKETVPEWNEVYDYE